MTRLTARGNLWLALAALVLAISFWYVWQRPTPTADLTILALVGIVIALGVLGMSVGLVRSETASDLRTLAATGASSATRRIPRTSGATGPFCASGASTPIRRS